MRSIFGVLSLLIVLAVVGLLAKKQLSNTTAPMVKTPADSGAVSPNTTPGASPREQSQQIQQQIKQSVEAALQQTRPEPDDK